MEKWLISIIIILLLLPLVQATQIQVSTDNSTWIDITNYQYNGVINETNKEAYLSFLKAKTTYYFRAKNETTSWYYLPARTGRINTMEIAIMFFISLLIITFIVLLIYFEHIAFKMLFGYLALGFMIIGINTARLLAIDADVSDNVIRMLNMVYSSLIWILWVLVALGFIYGLYHVFMLMKSLADKKKKKADF